VEEASSVGKTKGIIHFHLGDKPSLDVDNLSKPIFDVLEGIVYENVREIRQVDITNVRIKLPFVFMIETMFIESTVHARNQHMFERHEDPVETSPRPK